MGDMDEDATKQRREQRLRNHLIDYFALMESESELSALQVGGKATVFDLLFSQWDDWAWHEDPRREDFPPPVYSEEEFAAILFYHAAWNDSLKAELERLDSFEAVFARPQWTLLREAAARAGAVFRMRGRGPDVDGIDQGSC